MMRARAHAGARVCRVLSPARTQRALKTHTPALGQTSRGRRMVGGGEGEAGQFGTTLSRLSLSHTHTRIAFGATGARQKGFGRWRWEEEREREKDARRDAGPQRGRRRLRQACAARARARVCALMRGARGARAKGAPSVLYLSLSCFCCHRALSKRRRSLKSGSAQRARAKRELARGGGGGGLLSRPQIAPLT